MRAEVLNLDDDAPLRSVLAKPHVISGPEAAAPDPDIVGLVFRAAIAILIAVSVFRQGPAVVGAAATRRRPSTRRAGITEAIEIFVDLPKGASIFVDARAGPAP